jgi:hypothetical protein
MKHLTGLTLLLVMAFVLRLWHPSTSIGLDIHVHDTYHVIRLRIVASWCLPAVAFIWLGVLANLVFSRRPYLHAVPRTPQWQPFPDLSPKRAALGYR